MLQPKRLAVYDLVDVTTRTIAVIVRRWDPYFHPAILRGMQEAAAERDFEVVITNSPGWLKHRVDGLVYMDQEMPGVLFGRPGERRRRGIVVIDHARCGYLAAEQLIQQGCQRLLLLSPALNGNVALQRLAGFREALMRYGLPADGRLMITGDAESPRWGEDAMRQVLQMDPLPDGLFIADDREAIHCMNLFREAGAGNPAVVGFGDDVSGRIATPALTTITYPGYAVGRVTASRLLDRLCRREAGGRREEPSLQPQLIVRKSSLLNKK